MFKVEKGIPVPQNTGGFATRYPWDQLEPGDSFLIPKIGGEASGLTRMRANQATQYIKKKRGWTFACRANEDGVRVWRLT